MAKCQVVTTQSDSLVTVLICNTNVLLSQKFGGWSCYIIIDYNIHCGANYSLKHVD